MTIQQTGAVMDVLTVAYPQFYRGKDQRERQNALKLWAEMFSEDPLELVLAAVKRLIATDTKGYPPPIGAVKEQIWQVQHPQQMTEQEAWRLVAKAVNTADAERSFAALPPEVQQAVGSPVQLAEWGRMEETAFQSVVASNFQRAFRSRFVDDDDGGIAHVGDVHLGAALHGDIAGAEAIASAAFDGQIGVVQGPVAAVGGVAVDLLERHLGVVKLEVGLVRAAGGGGPLNLLHRNGGVVHFQVCVVGDVEAGAVIAVGRIPVGSAADGHVHAVQGERSAAVHVESDVAVPGVRPFANHVTVFYINRNLLAVAVDGDVLGDHILCVGQSGVLQQVDFAAGVLDRTQGILQSAGGGLAIRANPGSLRAVAVRNRGERAEVGGLPGQGLGVLVPGRLHLLLLAAVGAVDHHGVLIGIVR